MRSNRVLAGALVVAAVIACAVFIRPAPGTERQWTVKVASGPPPLHATPATLKRVFAGAQAGETILLASGRYGRFAGGMKDGMVTLAPERGADASISIAFAPARNITLDGLRITDLQIGGSSSKHLTVRDSHFDGAQAVIRTGELAHADILFEGNSHAGFDKCASCYEGRLQLVDRGDKPSGVTIRNSVFGPGGNSDGIQNGGYGVEILDNRFVDIRQIDGADGVHSDAIQLYGSMGTVIRGNEMLRVAAGIMAPDGADHELIEDNVIETDGYPYAITIGGDDGSIIRGNRLPGGACHYELPCGTLRISPDNDGGVGQGTVVEDNELGALAVEPGAVLASETGNIIDGD